MRRLLDDSGPPLSDEEGGGLVELVAFAATSDSRIGLISSLQDLTTRNVYGRGYPDCEDPTTMPAEVLAAGLAELRDEIAAPHANVRTFYRDGEDHVWTDRDLTEVTVRAESLADWLTAMVDRDAEWHHVAP